MLNNKIEFKSVAQRIHNHAQSMGISISRAQALQLLSRGCFNRSWEEIKKTQPWQRPTIALNPDQVHLRIQGINAEGTVYWSNLNGWTSEKDATLFYWQDMESCNLPIDPAYKIQWVAYGKVETQPSYFLVRHARYFTSTGQPVFLYSHLANNTWQPITSARQYQSASDVPEMDDDDYYIEGYAQLPKLPIFQKIHDNQFTVTVQDNPDIIMDFSTPTWIYHGPFSIHSIPTDEGLVVDVYSRGDEDADAIGSTYVFTAETAYAEYLLDIRETESQG